MLNNEVERYVALRRALGSKLQGLARSLHLYARFAAERGDTLIRTATAEAWAALGTSSHARYLRLRQVARFARFVHADDPAHEVPSLLLRRSPYLRPLPYIYTPDEIGRLLAATGRLRRAYPLRRAVYQTLLGLIAATGRRLSEALNLRLDDVLSEGVLHIGTAKFGKSRLVPLHPTVRDALDRYLALRRRLATTHDHVFVSARNRRISSCMAEYTFRRILKLAQVGTPGRARPPRIHDLRHTFATRALESCPGERRAVARHFVALSTYLGHVDIRQTYWYLEATPDLMTDIASAGEALVDGGGR